MIMWPSYSFDWGRDPAGELDRLHDEVNRLFSGYGSGRRYPAVNIWTSEDAVRAVAEVPGVKPEDLNIQIEGTTLELSGERQSPEIEEGEKYLQQHQRYGAFRRLVELPYEVEHDKIKAVCRNGVLEIVLPRSEATKPRRIEVQTS